MIGPNYVYTKTNDTQYTVRGGNKIPSPLSTNLTFEQIKINN